MAYMKSSEVAEIRRLARLLYFSDETIDAFCEKASAGQLRALGDVIEYEQGVRARRKRERL